MLNNDNVCYILHKTIGFLIFIIGIFLIDQTINFIIDNISFYETDSHVGTIIATILLMVFSSAIIIRFCFIVYNKICDILEKNAEDINEK